MDVNTTISLIRAAMKERHLTQADLAKKLGVSQNQVSQYLAGVPRLDTFLKMADAIGINAAELLAPDQPRENTTLTTAICPHCGKPLTITIK